MKRAIERVTQPAITFAKWAGLAVIFSRFHGTWLGLMVVVLMGLLLFRVDRTIWRFATNGSRS